MSETPDGPLSMSRVECAKCGAVWINGQHYWRTGCVGNEADLASLVCQPYGDDQCINPQKHAEGGDTWAQRLADLEALTDRMNEA